MQVELLPSGPRGVAVGKLSEMGIWHRGPHGALFLKMLEPGAAEGKGRGIKSLHVVAVFHVGSQCASGLVGLASETKVGTPCLPGVIPCMGVPLLPILS